MLDWPVQLAQKVMGWIATLAAWFSTRHIGNPGEGLSWLIGEAWRAYIVLVRKVLAMLPIHTPLPLPPVQTLPKMVAALFLFDRVFPLTLLFLLFAVCLGIQMTVWIAQGIAILVKAMKAALTGGLAW